MKKNRKLLSGWAKYVQTVVRSVTDLRFYREVPGKKVSEAVGYLAVLLILFWVIPLSITFFFGIRQGLDFFLENLRKTIPPGTVFELKDQKLATTLESPIVIREGENTIIVNTATSTLALDENEIGVVIGPEGIVNKQAVDHFETIGYSTFPEFKISREGIDEWIGQNMRWMILLVSIIALPIFAIMLAAGYGLYVMFYALALWVVMKILKRPWSYARTFTVAVYAATMPIIVKSVFAWSHIDSGMIPTVLYLVLLGFIAYDAYRRGVTDERKEKASGPGEASADRFDKSEGQPGAGGSRLS